MDAAPDTPTLERRLFPLAVVLLTLVSLWPIWSMRFLPMQDYPGHLLQVHRVSTRHDPGVDYDKYFSFHLKPGPYQTFFLLTRALDRWLPIETAGKVAVSLYVLLVGLLALRLARARKTAWVPWGLLLLFPVAFNQQYFLGFINYLYSIPMLILALLGHDELMGRPGIRPAVECGLWTLLLFFTHPFNFLVFIGLATWQLVMAWRSRQKLWPGAAVVAASSGLIVAWFAVLPDTLTGRMEWDLSAREIIISAGCFFTGMRWYDGVDKAATLAWLGVAVLLGVVIATDRESRVGLRSRYLLFFGLTTLGLFVLPYRTGLYAFINLRIIPVTLFFLALTVSFVRLRSWQKPALLVLVAVCLALSFQKQRQVSAEVEEILPVLEKLPPGVHLLPLVFDNTSEVLDPRMFDPHLHVPNYYHLIVGGGYSPYMWRTRVFPVQYKEGVWEAAPGPPEYYPHLFRWEEHAASFEYFLLRGAPAEFLATLSRTAYPVSISGRWQLFRRAGPVPETGGVP